jgi:putative redox protein
MSTRSVSADWLGGYKAKVTAGHFEFLVDEPVTAGGEDTGPQPTDYFLASLASCFVLAMAWSARKHSLELPPLTVNVTGTYDGPRFSAVAIDVVVALSDDKAKRLIESAERVCYVTNTLRRQPAISVRHLPS